MKLTLVLCLMLCLWALGSEGGNDNGEQEVGECIYNNLKYSVKDRHVDVMELMDHSASIDESDYNLGVDALKDINDLIDGFSSAPGIQGGNPGSKSRVGYVKFSQPDKTKTMIELNAINDVEQIKSNIDIPFDNGYATAMTTALELADTQFVWDRSYQNKRVWLVTDGENNRGGVSLLAANTLKSWQTHICVVAVGTSNMPTLEQIASFGYNCEPCVCKVPSYKKLVEATKWAVRKMKKAIKKKGAKKTRG